MTEATTAALDLTSQAARDAAAAARRSQVVVETTTDLVDLRQVVALFDRVWDNAGPPVIGLELLRALAHAGNYVAVAYDLDSRAILGAAVGFFGAPVGRVLHSDVTGVDRAARDRKLGFSLKLHQRAWALERGIDEITWTYDPLIARNAFFNLRKLRANAVRYYVDFYGDMGDGINMGQGSDRLLTSWPLGAPEVVQATALDANASGPEFPDASPLLSYDERGPLLHDAAPDAAHVLIAVPPDIEALRRTDAGLAREWRSRVRETLGTELNRGARVVGFDPFDGYVVERATPDAERHPA